MSRTNYSVSTICYDSGLRDFVWKPAEISLGPNDVLIKTTHSGLCTTDVHAKEKGCGLGHEGIGYIEKIGEAVTNLEPDQRVGWGWLHSVSMNPIMSSQERRTNVSQSCLRCKTCASGYRQYCAEARGFAFSDLNQGAFSTHRIINSNFVYPIPEEIESVHAAPLMCAGASTFEALQAANTKPGDRVGVVGVGGLGHIAILFAKSMGCGVTAISSDTGKLEDAMKLGADEFRCTSDLAKRTISMWPGVFPSHSDLDPRELVEMPELSPRHMSIDVLLITSNVVPDLEKYLPLLARRATIVLMTIQQDPISIPYMPFVLPGHKLIASTEASHQNHLEMLDFVSRNRITPWVEKFPMTREGVAEAFAKLESGEMRYRGVLEGSDSI